MIFKNMLAVATIALALSAVSAFALAPVAMGAVA
jgi:hypothetical protein